MGVDHFFNIFCQFRVENTLWVNDLGKQASVYINSFHHSKNNYFRKLAVVYRRHIETSTYFGAKNLFSEKSGARRKDTGLKTTRTLAKWMVRWQKTSRASVSGSAAAPVDDGEASDVAINGVSSASSPSSADESGIAERVVAVKNPSTGEIELKEEKMLVNVQAGDEEEEPADEVDDSKSNDPSAAYTKTSENIFSLRILDHHTSRHYFCYWKHTGAFENSRNKRWRSKLENWKWQVNLKKWKFDVWFRS